MGYIPQDDGEFDANAYAQSLLGSVPRPASKKRNSSDYDHFIEESSARHGVDPDLIRRQMGTESSFNPNAKSPKNALGLMQMLPDTFARMKVGSNIYDPQQNIEGGVKYMRQLLDMFGGDVSLALAGYNAGEGAVKKYGNKIPPYAETRNYVKQIGGGYTGNGYLQKFDPNTYAQQLLGQVAPEESEFDADEYANTLLSSVGDPETSPTPEPYDSGLIYGQPADTYDLKGGQTVSPTFATPQPADVTPPVPEQPDALQAQIISTFDPDSPKSMVLLTTGNPANNFLLSMAEARRLTRVDTPNGIVLVNAKKLGIKPLQAKDYVKKNGFAKDAGFVIDMGNNTGDGQPAVAAVDPNTGKEVFAAVTPDERSAQAQVTQNKAMFPGTVQVSTDTDEVVTARAAETAIDPDAVVTDPVYSSQEAAPLPDDIEAQLGMVAPKPPNNELSTNIGEEAKNPTVNDPAIDPKIKPAVAAQANPVAQPAKQKVATKDEPFDEKQFNDANAYLTEQGQPLLTKEQYQSAIKSFKGGTSVSLPNVGEVDGQAVVGESYREPVEMKEIQAKDAGGAYADIIDIPDSVKTSEQAGEYALKYLQAKYPDGTFTGATFPQKWEVGDKKIGITYDTLQGAGVNVKPEISQKVVENRVENPKPDLRVGRDWVKEDAEALNNAIGGIPAGYLANNLNAGGHTAKRLAGLLRLIGELNPAKLDSMAEASNLKPYRPAEDIVQYLKNIAETTGSLATNTGVKYQDTATKDDSGYLEGRPIERETWASKGSKAVGALADLPGLALLPGGLSTPILSFAADSALQAASEGEKLDWSKVKHEGAKGAGLGAVAMVAPIVGKAGDTVIATAANRASSNVLKEGITLGTLGTGTYATSRAMGDTQQQAFDNAVLFSAFHAIGVAKKAGKDIVGTAIRVKDPKGNEAVIEITKNGEVKTLDPATEAKAQIEIPKDFVPKFTEAEKAAATNVKMDFDPKAEVQVKTEPVKAPETVVEADLVKAAKTETPVVKESLTTEPKAEVAKDVEVITEPVVADRAVGTDKPKGKPSRVGLDVEAKAIEQKLTKGFEGVAEFDPITIKEQAKKGAELVETNLEKAKAMMRGTEPIPNDLRGSTVISALERHAQKTNDVGLLRELAQSPLTSETSRHAQEMRLMAERNPDSPIHIIKGIQEARISGVKQRGGKVADIEKKIEALENKIVEREAKLETIQKELALKDLEYIASPPHILQVAERIVTKLDARADAARKRLEKRGNIFTAGIDPVALKDLAEIGAAHIGKVGLDFAKWSTNMVGEFGEKIKPHLKAIYDRATTVIDTFGGSKEVRSVALDPEAKAAAALKGAKARLTKQINALETQISARERTPKKNEPIEYDAEALALKTRRDALKQEFDEIFNTKGLSDEQRLKAFKTRTEKRIDELQKEMTDPTFERPQRREPVKLDAEGESLRQRKDLLMKKVSVTDAEVQRINELTNELEATRDRLEGNRRKADEGPTPEELAYGRAATELTDYVGDIKLEAQKTKWEDVKAAPVRNIARLAGKAIVESPGLSKSILAAFDNSAIFRQGWKTLFTNPVIWQQNARKTFKDIYHTFGGKNVAAELKADIVSRPNYDLMKKAKLDVGTMEEAFPSALPEKIPFLRRAYKASENAYTGFLHKTRADIFDKYIEIAKTNEVDLNKTELENIGRLVNSLTGRGYLGKAASGADAINTLFFSPRNFKAHIDTLMQPMTGGATIREIGKGENTGSSFVRKRAAENLVKQMTGTATVLAIAKAIAPDAVELDPRSSDFGKIKVGNTRFDVTGGMGSFLTLTSRLLTSSSKSSTSGKITDLANPGYKGSTGWSVLIDFLSNKFSPMARVGMEFLKGETFDGEKPTVGSQALSLITPLPVKTFLSLLNDPEARKHPEFIAFAQAMDMLGITVNTYGKKGDDTSRISPDAREVQLKATKLRDAMDKLEKSPDDAALKQLVHEKIDNKYERGQLTFAEAERANKILGFEGDEAYQGQVENADKPEINKYNKNADGIIEKVTTWAEAIGTDPLDAFDKLFKGEYIARMENGAIIVKRMDLSASAKERQRLGGGGKEVKLDHHIPLQLGGTNAKDNLRLVTTAEWERFTPIENYLGGALHDGVINGEKARELIKKFKQGSIGEEDIINEVGVPFKVEEATVPGSRRKKSMLTIPKVQLPKIR